MKASSGAARSEPEHNHPRFPHPPPGRPRAGAPAARRRPGSRRSRTMTASWTPYLAALRAGRSGNPRARAKPQFRRRKLAVELLEDRTLLAVTPTLSGGLLDIRLD